jgi:hypothetical protein
MLIHVVLVIGKTSPRKIFGNNAMLGALSLSAQQIATHLPKGKVKLPLWLTKYHDMQNYPLPN